MAAVTLPAAVALAGSLLHLALGYLVYRRRNHRPQLARRWGVYASLATLWMGWQFIHQMGWVNLLTADALKQLAWFAFFSLAVSFFFLTRSFLEAPGSGFLWGALGVAWTAAGGMLAYNLFSLPGYISFGSGWGFQSRSLAGWLWLAGWAIFLGGAARLTARTLRTARHRYTAVSYWVICIFLLVLGNGLFFLGQTSLGNVLHGVSSLLAAYLMVAVRLPELSNLARRSLSSLVFGVLALLIYALSALAAYLLLQKWLQLSPIWYSLGLAAALVLLFNPFVGRLQHWVNQRFGQRDQSLTELLSQYSQSITNTLDLNLLATVAIGTASEYLEINRGFLFLVEVEKASNGNDRALYTLRGVRGMGKEDPVAAQFPEESTLVTYFREEYKPLQLSEIDVKSRFEHLSAEERQWLHELGAEVLAPIFAKNEWIGLLACGPKGSGAAYSAQDLVFVRMMADQTAVALENTRLVDGLMRVNKDFRRAYEALDQANRNLERLDKTKSDFISIASHELRTPLTLIGGASQMLLDEEELQSNPYYQQLLEKMISGTTRLHEIVDSMLDVAKIDTRALELEPQPVSLNSLIRGVCTDLMKAVAERQQTLEIINLDQLPAITADAAALRKVFHHLIINAIKYTPDNGTITISGRALDPNLTDLPHGGVEVVVRDTGIGIDPRFHELIFAKFYQTGELAFHSSGKTKFKGGGPGLGLAIVRGIIEAHHGRVWVESSGYDETHCPGSAFYVVLPLDQQPSQSPQPPRRFVSPPL